MRIAVVGAIRGHRTIARLGSLGLRGLATLGSICVVIRAEEIVLGFVLFESCPLSRFLVRLALLLHGLLSSKQCSFSLKFRLRWSIHFALPFCLLELPEIAFDFVNRAMVALLGSKRNKAVVLGELGSCRKATLGVTGTDVGTRPR